jgi:hypothetical protein
MDSFSLRGQTAVLNARETLNLLAHAFVGWAVCGALMGIGLVLTTEMNALILHAIGGPLFYIFLSRYYFRNYNHTTPLATAVVFISFVILVDVFIVALLILNSFEMFYSPLGTWIPFTLIFIATYLTGRLTTNNQT